MNLEVVDCCQLSNILPLILQVKAVLFTIEAGVATVALQGSFAKQFFRFLDSNHVPPQNRPYMRMVRLLELAFFREYRRLIDDNVLLSLLMFSSSDNLYDNKQMKTTTNHNKPPLDITYMIILI